MEATRRRAILAGLGAAGALGALARAASAQAPGSGDAARSAAGSEGGTFINPAFAGDRSDPSILKDGEDYWLTHTPFVYRPGIMIWHSRDLLNWSPVGPALRAPLGTVNALDVARHDGRYFIYVPAVILGPGPADYALKVFVIHADSMRGPWSEPIDLGVEGVIDPGHAVGEDGRRWLFVSGGQRVPLAPDGLSATGPLEKVYDGWRWPEEWVVETRFLEGPKVVRHGGWFHLFSADGGTAGPPTSHMVIAARSRSIDGPWENCPWNPIVRTASRDEPWWSRGHATPVEGPDGRWWLAYHGYQNGLRTLGRQMLLDPLEWTADGWPRALGGDLSGPLPLPAPGVSRGPAGAALSGPFAPEDLGPRLAFYDPSQGYEARASFAGGALILAPQGDGPAASSPLAMNVGDPAYAVTVDVEPAAGGEGGLLLFYDDRLFVGLGVRDGVVRAYDRGAPDQAPPLPAPDGRARLRVAFDRDVATVASSVGGGTWRVHRSFDVSGYHHNVRGGFLSLRPALFATGVAPSTFRDLRHTVPA